MIDLLIFLLPPLRKTWTTTSILTFAICIPTVRDRFCFQPLFIYLVRCLSTDVPEEYFCRLSKTLEAFFRSTLGGRWFYDEPEIPVKDCFPDLLKLQKKLSQAKETLSSSSESADSEDDSVRTVAKSLGCMAANDGASGPLFFSVQESVLNIVE